MTRFVVPFLFTRRVVLGDECASGLSVLLSCFENVQSVLTWSLEDNVMSALFEDEATFLGFQCRRKKNIEVVAEFAYG